MGVGILNALEPPKYLYRGIPKYFEAASAQASETLNIALAPNLFLFGVPSNSIKVSSISSCSRTS